MFSKELDQVIATSRMMRDRIINSFDAELIERSLIVKAANSLAAQNHNIISVHAIDLRERILAAEAATVERMARRTDAIGPVETEVADPLAALDESREKAANKQTTRRRARK